MDADHLFRSDNQMSYQQQQLQQRHNLINSSGRQNRGHYSNRQLKQQVDERLASRPDRKQEALHTGSGSSSENDDSNQLSSISSTTNKTSSSSQQAMLSSHSNIKTSPRQHLQQQQQQHRMMQQQQQQQQQHQQQQKHRQQQQQQQHMAAQHHRQQALQSQTLAAPGKSGGANFAKVSNSNNSSSITSHQQQQQQQQQQHHVNDNMTTSSSDHTIDDLRHLAHGYHHRLTGSRYSSEGAAGSAIPNSGGRFLLGVLFTLAELLLFATVLLWLYWSYQHDDGLSWQTDRKQQFNTHAALMLFGFIFLNGQAMLIYRSFQCCSKIYTKILHTILFVLATSAISLGLILGFTAQENVGPNSKPIMHFYSLHAWVGLTTIGLFVFQFVFGFVSFLILLCCDRATSKFRAALLPIHKTFGLIIFSLAVATCLTGLLQTARSRLSSKLNKIDYHELSEAGIVINLIGVCLICLAILLPYIIRNLEVKRTFKSELDRHLKLSQLDMRI